MTQSNQHSSKRQYQRRFVSNKLSNEPKRGGSWPCEGEHDIIEEWIWAIKVHHSLYSSWFSQGTATEQLCRLRLLLLQLFEVPHWRRRQIYCLAVQFDWNLEFVGMNELGNLNNNLVFLYEFWRQSKSDDFDCDFDNSSQVDSDFEAAIKRLHLSYCFVS